MSCRFVSACNEEFELNVTNKVCVFNINSTILLNCGIKVAYFYPYVGNKIYMAEYSFENVFLLGFTLKCNPQNHYFNAIT